MAPVEFGSGEASGSAIGALRAAFTPSAVRYAVSQSPFSTLFVDLTHRCNMECRNCYIPVRGLPDLPSDWLYDMLGQLPRRARIRLVGAEPTMREDLPQIIATVRALGHTPILLTNGLKLGRRSYVAQLKAAGLRTLHFSANGGLDDDLYEALDDLRCARRKLLALDNCLAERMNVTIGMILAPGVNEHHVPEFLAYLMARGVRDIHLRSVGPMGRHMEGEAFSLDALESQLRAALPEGAHPLLKTSESGSSRDFRFGPVRFQITEWPDLGSTERGRLTPDGFVEPMFESIQANEFQY